MSSSDKTEKATPKRRKDSAKKGQSVRARDLVVACITLGGVLAVVSLGSLTSLGAAFIGVVHSNFDLDLHKYVTDVLLLGLKVILPIIAISIVATALPSLLLSRFVLATDALKLNFAALNPVSGLKKMFSLRTVKDFIKALLYLASFSAAAIFVWHQYRGLLFSQVHASIAGIVAIWGKMIVSLVLISLGCISVILILDALAELFLHLKDLRMDKQEVKRERKNEDGDPMTKRRRHEIYLEMLTAEEKHDIRNSRMVIANPTHIAIGIYFKPEVAPIPLVSIKAVNQRALAVRAYARTVDVPVITDIALARRLYRTHKLYSIISMEEIYHIVRLLLWLREVEMAGVDATRTDGDEMRSVDPEAPATSTSNNTEEKKS